MSRTSFCSLRIVLHYPRVTSDHSLSPKHKTKSAKVASRGEQYNNQSQSGVSVGTALVLKSGKTML
jgi:hypothetical protein